MFFGISHHKIFPPGTSNDGEMAAGVAAGFQSEHGYFSDVEDENDEASDEEYMPREALRREIRVGPEYQADVPSCTEPGTAPLENGTNGSAKEEDDANEDLLLWKPGDADEDKGILNNARPNIALTLHPHRRL